MVEGTVGSHHKEGSRKMSKHSIVCAGIDTGKHKLDVALPKRVKEVQVDNTPDGHVALSAWLRQQGVDRVGIEASGGYEQEIVAHLRRDSFVVIVLQPTQVRAYAKFLLQRAKNDKIDAGLIAACTAATEKIHVPPDPRLAPFAEHLTLIEQITQDIACCKTRRETCRAPRIRQFWKEEIARSTRLLNSELKTLATAIRQHRDLAERLDLIVSVDGVGLRTAVAILVRMPEIGRVTREHAASLAGLAPFDDDSADRIGARHIRDGRARLRASLYAAALPAAFRWNHRLMALYRRLTAAGKPHKVALIACARKLLIFANTVVERGTPWVAEQPIPSNLACTPRHAT
jgi:transposase